MKKILFFIALLFPFFGSYAQGYIPFPETNAKWVTNIYYSEPQMKLGSYCYDSHMETIGDTIMNGLKYIKLKETKVSYSAAWFACFTQVDTITSSFYGWIRNDTINKKVYFRKRNWNKDTLLYDFSLKIGDTLNDTYLLNNYTQLNLYTVDTIKNYVIGGINRKVYFIDEGDYILTDSIIEGIGNSKGIFSEYKNYKVDYTFLCLNISGTKIYPQDSSSCPVITSINEKSKYESEINIYPNPVTDQFEIEKPANLNIELAVLFDCTGRMVKKFPSNSENYQVKDVPKGMYIFRLKADGHFFSEKIVIK